MNLMSKHVFIIICMIKFVPDLYQKAGIHEPAGEGMGRDGFEAVWSEPGGERHQTRP